MNVFRKLGTGSSIAIIFSEILVSIILATLAMIFIYSLPTEKCIKNLEKSVSIYEKEENYPCWSGIDIIHSKLDNWTDSIMILMSTYPNKQDGIIKSSMMNTYLRGNKLSPADSLVKIGKNDESIKINKINYSRYWHGYVIILKPLLIFTDVNHIRSFNSYCVLILFFLSGILFYKRLGIFYSIAYLLSIMTLNLVSIAMSFQFSSIYYIGILFTIFLLLYSDYLLNKNLLPYFFTLIGIFVAFFDFLTYPIVAFGLPFITLYLLNRDYILNIKNSLFLIFSSGFGYLGMWFGKWFVCWLLTGYNCFLEAINNIKKRTLIDTTFQQEYKVTPLNALFKNIVTMFNDPIFIFIFSFIVFIIIFNYIKNKKITIYFSWKTLIFYISLMLIPICWLLITSGHSQLHFWFTYRNLSVFIFALLCFIIEYFRFDKKENKEETHG